MHITIGLEMKANFEIIHHVITYNSAIIGHGESLRLICNQFGIIQVLQRIPIPQISNWPGTFFSVSYSKTALTKHFCNKMLRSLPLITQTF